MHMPELTILGACVLQSVLTLDAVLQFLYHISPALVAVGLGTFLVQKFFVSRSNEAAQIDVLLRDFDTLRSDSLEYWNLPCEGPDNKQRQQVLAQKIKGSIKGISSDIAYYCSRYCSDKKEHLATLMIEVADACTGGEFESAKKRVDASRYLLIINAINHVRSELFRRKL